MHEPAVVGEGYGLATSMAAAAKNGRIESDAYQRALQESLLQLAGDSSRVSTNMCADIGRLQNKGLEQHMEDLDDMEQQVSHRECVTSVQLPVLLDSVSRQNQRIANIR